MQTIPISLRRIAMFLGIFMMAWLVIEFNARLQELNLLNSQRDIIRIAATQSMQTEMALQVQVTYASSTEAVEAWAYNEAHLVRDGDQAVIPVGVPGSDPVSVPTPTPVPTPKPNWQEWWVLFFGK
jgi:hypothetical protein